MEKTPFAGLTQLDGGEPLSVDGYSFQHENPRITDRLLEIGSIGHHHDAPPPLPAPTDGRAAPPAVEGGNSAATAGVGGPNRCSKRTAGEAPRPPAEGVPPAPPLAP